MAEDVRLEIYRNFKQAQNQYVYFLITVALALIGFAANQSINKKLSGEEIALGIAVLFWVSSIISGLLNRQDDLRCIKIDMSLKSYGHPSELEAKFENVAESGNEHFNRQGNFLLLGLGAYIIWHILVMANNS